jgi:hypothetical protein
MTRRNLYILLVFITISGTVFGQNNLSSPYTRYGLGTLNNRNTIFCTSMGGLSQAVQLPFVINSGNPASYNAIDTLGFIIDGSMVTVQTNSKTEFQNQSSNYSSLGYFNVGFTIYKGWKSVIGIQPFSDVGYKITTAGVDAHLGNYTYNYIGSGGLSQVFWGNSLRLMPGLSIGLNTSYLFGTINRQRVEEFSDITNIGLDTKNKTYIRGLNFLSGIQYKKKLKNDYYVTLGATAGLKSNISATDDVFTTTFIMNASGAHITKDTVENYNNKVGTIVLPLTAGGGISFGKEDKFMIGADFNWQNWSKYTIFDTSDSLTDSYQVAIGGMFIPDAQSQKLFQKIRYRAGFRFQKSYLDLKNTSINEFGINFGLSIPIKKKSSLNIGVEYGAKGTVANNLIKESFTRVYIGFQLWDNMFTRRKLD